MRENLCKTEVENFGAIALRNKNVGGLDVAVHDAFCMRGIQSINNFDCQLKECFVIERVPFDGVLQSFALEILHGDEALRILFANFVNCTDVWVVERRSGTGFPSKPFERVGITS
jgi:hypothetical protein